MQRGENAAGASLADVGQRDRIFRHQRKDSSSRGIRGENIAGWNGHGDGKLRLHFLFTYLWRRAPLPPHVKHRVASL